MNVLLHKYFFEGSIPRESKWDVVVDLFFYRDPEEAEKDDQATKEITAPLPKVSINSFVSDFYLLHWL